MDPVKGVVAECSICIGETVIGGGAVVVDDVVVKVVGLVSAWFFVDDLWRKVRRDVKRIVVDVGAGEVVAERDESAFVVLADVVADDDVGVFFDGAEPDKAVVVIVAVTILPDGSRAFEVSIVEAAIVFCGAV